MLGRALQGERREGLEIFTKVFWPTGPGRNDRGLSRKHIMESINGSLRRLQTDYVDLYQAHRYDYATPLEETMEAFADVVRAGKAHYIGVSEWKAVADPRRRTRSPGSCSIPLVSNQPQYSMLWRVIEAEVVPDLRGAGHRPDRLVADRAGRADRQVPAGPAAAGRLPGHRREVRRRLHRAVADRRGADRGCSSSSRSPSRPG